MSELCKGFFLAGGAVLDCPIVPHGREPLMYGLTLVGAAPLPHSWPWAWHSTGGTGAE